MEPQPGWVVALVEIVALQDLRGLQLASVELLDSAGRVVATASTELELRRAPSGRRAGDLSRQGTEELGDGLSAGATATLWAHARLDGDLDAIAASGPTMYRARLRTAGGGTLLVEAPLGGMWPTA